MTKKDDKDYTSIYMIERFQEIISGTRSPQNKEEDIFVVAYNTGMTGEGIFDIYVSIEETGLTLNEINIFVMGYALGQRSFEEFGKIELETDNKQFH